MNNTKKKILVTCALPYANGSLHLGHMLEHIQADIWVRYQKMRGKIIYFICADDAHGTAIMLKAQNLGISPEIMIKKIQKEHNQDLKGFLVNYDNYHSTHSIENFELSTLIYSRLQQKGLINSQLISQLYDLEKKMFLPDRFIKGQCPKCQALEQYGDNCEICGAIYQPTDLINPKSTISNTVPVIQKTKHFFFNLTYFTNILYEWIQSSNLQKPIIKKIKEWFKAGLKPWNISRDAPYFGFKIPNSHNKYFYVWMDAPIGYMGTFKNLCNKKKYNISFEEFWNKNSKHDIYHFIGKDIIYFHALFWPAILEGSQFRKPTNLFVHGHLTINGHKISKSHGTMIKASTYLSYLNPDSLRYYYATKLSSNIDDIDLNFNELIHKINGDIVNKIVNLASRNAKFINQYCDGKLSNYLINPTIYNIFTTASNDIEESYQTRNLNQTTKKIIQLIDLANQYIDEQSPWTKQNNKNEAQAIYSMGIQLFRIIMTYMKPITPILAKNSEIFLNTILTWESIKDPLPKKHCIRPFKKLFTRITTHQINKIISESNNKN